VRQGGLKLWIYYAVTRTEALARVARETADIDFTDLLVFEAYHVMRILTLGKARSDDAAVSYVRQYGTSLYSAYKKDWIHHLLRNRFTSDVDALVERIAAQTAVADGSELATVAEDVRALLEGKFRQIVRANYGSLQEIKRAIRRRAPRFVTWWQNRPRAFVGHQRMALRRQLANAGASQEYVTQFVAEIATIENVLTGASFADFIRSYRPLIGEQSEISGRQV
jgi:hypothetical protein